MRCFALLRAINVGTHQVKMAQLRALFEEMSFADVTTFIASGNVIFEAEASDSSELEQRIEQHLAGALGYDVGTFIRTCGQLRAVVQHADSLGTLDGSLYVGFLKQEPAHAAADAIVALQTPDDQLGVHGRELYWRARSGVGRSRVTGAQLEKRAGPTTLRNITTVRNLVEKYC